MSNGTNTPWATKYAPKKSPTSANGSHRSIPAKLDQAAHPDWIGSVLADFDAFSGSRIGREKGLWHGYEHDLSLPRSTRPGARHGRFGGRGDESLSRSNAADFSAPTDPQVRILKTPTFML